MTWVPLSCALVSIVLTEKGRIDFGLDQPGGEPKGTPWGGKWGAEKHREGTNLGKKNLESNEVA